MMPRALHLSNKSTLVDSSPLVSAVVAAIMAPRPLERDRCQVEEEEDEGDDQTEEVKIILEGS